MMLMKYRPVVRAKRPVVTPPKMDNWMDEFFNDFEQSFFNHAPRRTSARPFPATNVMEKDDAFQLEIAAPGLDKKDFQVAIEDNVLTIEVKREKEEKKESPKFLRREFNFFQFKRQFELPETVNGENVAAAYEDGVLKLTLPKKEEAKKLPPKSIEIA